MPTIPAPPVLPPGTLRSSAGPGSPRPCGRPLALSLALAALLSGACRSGGETEPEPAGPGHVAREIEVSASGDLTAAAPAPAHDTETETEAERADEAPARRLELAELPREVPDFALIDQHGDSFQLSRMTYVRAVVLVAFGRDCPELVREQATIAALAERHAADVAFLYLDATGNADRAGLLALTEERGLELSVLTDASGLVAEAVAFQRVGEALLVEQATGEILYRGPVSGPGDETGLAGALEAWSAGRAIEPAAALTEPAAGGCRLETAVPRPAAGAAISYVDEIVPLLRDRCVSCHSDGGIAPFALARHAKVRQWSPMIAEVVRTRRMPPWAADPAFGSFQNDISLSPDEQRTLLHWIEAGCRSDVPEGGADPLVEIASAAASRGQEWPLGEPDLVVPLEHEEELPAVGIPYYRYRWVDLPNTEDLWVRAVTIKPSNPRVAHHIVVIIEYPEELKALEPKQDNGTAGYFTVYKPNQPSQIFPEGTGKLIPAGSRAMFQLHYVTTGKPEKDLPVMGLYLLDEPPAKQLHTTGLNDPYIVIPPHARHHEIQAERGFPRDVLLYSLGPHMHYRGRAMRAEAVYPDGRVETLLNVPRYDFNWQDTYWFDEPIRLPFGTKIRATAVWDNSRHNPSNPNPKRRLVFGQDSYSEMFILYMDYMELD